MIHIQITKLYLLWLEIYIHKCMNTLRILTINKYVSKNTVFEPVAIINLWWKINVRSKLVGKIFDGKSLKENQCQIKLVGKIFEGKSLKENKCQIKTCRENLWRKIFAGKSVSDQNLYGKSLKENLWRKINVSSKLVGLWTYNPWT